MTTPLASVRARPERADDGRWRRAALLVLCLGELLIVLDTTIVNVALPSIRSSLGFSQASLAWVVNAYTLGFGGFLLPAGRLGDLYGRRRWFAAGTALFTIASLLCGLSGTQAELIAARGIQGLGGAIVAAISLSLITSLFPEAPERSRAMAVFGFVTAGGGCVGVLAGGVLTGLLDWHWIFLVNVPAGIAVCVLSGKVLPGDSGPRPAERRLDVTLPRRLVRAPNFVLANAIGIGWAAALFTWFFFSALYLQVVLGYSPVRVGLAFLPASLLMALVSLRLSARLVSRLGQRIPLAGGLVLAAAGLTLLSRAPAPGGYAGDVLLGMILFGVAGGIVLNPLLLAATGGIPAGDAGMASGAVNASFMIGGALSLGILAAVSDARTASLMAAGQPRLDALNEGYHLAFAIGAGLALAAACLTALLDRKARKATHARGAQQ